MSNWLGVMWMWLLPPLSSLAALSKLRAARAAHARGMMSQRGWRWMAGGIAAAQTSMWLAQLAVVYQASILPPAAALAALSAALFAMRAARAEIHPGLRGLQRALPRDGLDVIEARPTRRADWLLVAPSLLIILGAALAHPERWPPLALLGMIHAAPLLLIPYRRQWLSPALLALPLLALAAQAASLRAALPDGLWAAPINGARCSGQIKLFAGSAWCANPTEAAVYQFDMETGFVKIARPVQEAVRIFAANASRAWVQQSPARGLVVVDEHSTGAQPLVSAHLGAADSDDRLWVIDVGMELTLYANGEATRLLSADGLLNNTANIVKVSPAGDVWVGSIGGLSYLRAGESLWRTLDKPSGVPGPVINFAFGPNDTVWMIWKARPGFSAPTEWGLTALDAANGEMRHYDVGPATGLEAPLGEDGLAVDGYGRLWLATQSIVRREKILAIVTLDDGSPQVYSLGMFSTGGPFAYGFGLWQNSFGVVSDGAGGIILYNADDWPWRRWRPGWRLP